MRPAILGEVVTSKDEFMYKDRAQIAEGLCKLVVQKPFQKGIQNCIPLL